MDELQDIDWGTLKLSDILEYTANIEIWDMSLGTNSYRQLTIINGNEILQNYVKSMNSKHEFSHIKEKLVHI